MKNNNNLSEGQTKREQIGHKFAQSICTHLVRADVDEALDAGQFRGLEQHVRAEDVVLRELERVTEGVVDVGLGREVHDRVDLLRLQHEVHQVGAADVALHELVVGVVLDLVEVGQARAVCGVKMSVKERDEGREERRVRTRSSLWEGETQAVRSYNQVCRS